MFTGRLLTPERGSAHSSATGWPFSREIVPSGAWSAGSRHTQHRGVHFLSSRIPTSTNGRSGLELVNISTVLGSRAVKALGEVFSGISDSLVPHPAVIRKSQSETRFIFSPSVSYAMSDSTMARGLTFPVHIADHQRGGGGTRRKGARPCYRQYMAAKWRSDRGGDAHGRGCPRREVGAEGRSRVRR